MNDPSSPDSGIERGWTTEARTSMCQSGITLEYYAEIDPTRNKFGTGYYAHCDLKRSEKLSNAASLLRNGYKGIRLADLRILYDAIVLRGGNFFVYKIVGYNAYKYFHIQSVKIPLKFFYLTRAYLKYTMTTQFIPSIV